MMSSIAALLKYRPEFARNHVPGQVVIQITNRCNARCPQCGMRRTAEIQRGSLNGDTIKRILDCCAAQDVQAISFTGGEPLILLDDVVKWIRYAGKVGIPFIRTGTNGFLFGNADHPGFSDRMKHLADRLAATPLRNFWISLDSCIPEVHEQMRGLPGVVAGIEKALPIFHAAGIYPSANLGINRLVGGRLTSEIRSDMFANRSSYLDEFHRRYLKAFDQFYLFVSELGFTIVNTCYPMSISSQEQQSGLNAVYAATSIGDVVRFAPDEKAMLYRALFNAIPRHRERVRIFSPLSSIYVLYKSYGNHQSESNAYGCRGGVDFFFIDAIQGDIYPCGYRGHEKLGKIWELNLSALNPQDACHRCDWECFRDPSELFSPFLQILHEPVELFDKMTKDTQYRHLWWKDLKYYKRCDLFDGRCPPKIQH